jgi:cell wall-associated NlpC family hydrolase
VTPFFNSQWQIERLAQEAARWIGTPFVAHSRVPGAGVDCVNLAAALYLETGAMESFNPPAYSLDSGQHDIESRVLHYLDGHPSFKPIFARHVDKEYSGMAGDLLCFKFARSEHHVGVLMTYNRFIHARNRRNVEMTSLTDPVYARCLTYVFRPVLQEVMP